MNVHQHFDFFTFIYSIISKQQTFNLKNLLQMHLALIYFTNNGYKLLQTSKHLKIEYHYALINKINDKVYASIMTTKPFGKSYKIADKCIDYKFKGPQYLLDRTYLIDSKIMYLKQTVEGNKYFVEHAIKFKQVLVQIDYTKVIDLMS